MYIIEGWNYLREVHLGQGMWLFGKESNFPVRKGVKESVDGVRIFSLRNLMGNCLSWHLSSGSQEAMARDDRGWIIIVLIRPFRACGM